MSSPGAWQDRLCRGCGIVVAKTPEVDEAVNVAGCIRANSAGVCTQLFDLETLSATYVRRESFRAIERLLPAHIGMLPIELRALARELVERRVLTSIAAPREPPDVLSSDRSPAVRNLRVLCTFRCQLRCSYCQIVQNVQDVEQSLSISAARLRQAVEEFAVVAGDTPAATVTLTGGEPVFDLPKLFQLLGVIRSVLKSARVVLFTNGLELSPEICLKLAAMQCFVIVSLDGRSGSANRYRFGTSSELLARVKAALVALGQGRLPFGVSVTLTRSTLPSFFEEDVPYFLQTGAASLGVNVCHYLPASTESFRVEASEYADALFRVFTQTEGRLRVENVARFLGSVVMGKPHQRDCSAAGSGVTIFPDGSLAQCKSVGLVRGARLSGVTLLEYFASEQFERWRSRSTRLMDSCSGCQYRMLCGGGCGYDAYIRAGDFMSVIEEHCAYVKAIVGSLLQECVERAARVVQLSSETGVESMTTAERSLLFPSYCVDAAVPERSVGHE